MEKIIIAAAQTNPRLMKNRENLEKILSDIRQAAKNRAKLIVFPECGLTGYMFNSREEAWPYAETVPGPAVEAVAALCRELKVHVIFGLLERDGARLFNAAAFVGPEGLVGKYRKNHLPFLGIDRFVDRGDRPFEVHRTPVGNIGPEICYDIAFPESSRVLTLLGAEILVISTNFPHDRDDMIEYVIPARAVENTVYVVAADRVGKERGATFAGRSKIVDVSGKTLALASPDKEEIIYAGVDLEMARNKHITTVPGQYEVDRLKDRRPELYDVITRPLEDA
ncbi:MAG TPA: carbon-nitrogen hydrolase family protein [Dehalococcoidales bacterium]|nr:carbon-nitrogen hydrolase family protein [Dehalococcoidales bacterium]